MPHIVTWDFYFIKYGTEDMIYPGWWFVFLSFFSPPSSFQQFCKQSSLFCCANTALCLNVGQADQEADVAEK